MAERKHFQPFYFSMINFICNYFNNFSFSDRNFTVYRTVIIPRYSDTCSCISSRWSLPSFFHTQIMMGTVIAIATKSAIGAAQVTPITPSARGTVNAHTMRRISRRKESGAAIFASPMDCINIAQTFCRQVKTISIRYILKQGIANCI